MRIVLMYSLSPPSAGHLARLREMAPAMELVAVSSAAEAQAMVGDAEVILGHRFLRQAIPFAQRLRWVQSSAQGVDRLPLAELAARRVTVTRWTLDSDVVASHALALAWAVARGLPEAFRNQAAGHWSQGLTFGPLPRRALVLGQGSVGRAIAAHLKAQCIEVACGRLAAAPPHDDPYEAVLVGESWRRALPTFDWCFLALPHTIGTQRLFDEAALRALPRHAVLVNVGRGETLDTQALLQVLGEGHLTGAGLDVADIEPLPADHPLWRAPRVIVTPHVASHHPGRIERVERFFEEQLARYLAGKPLEAIVDLCSEPFSGQ